MYPAQNFAAELLAQVVSPKNIKNVWKSKKTRNIEKVKPCKIMFFGLNGSHMRAQDLNIGGFGTEFRDEAIGIGLRTQKHANNIEKNTSIFSL